VLLIVLAGPAIAAKPASPDFAGDWVLDYRSAQDRRNGVECGSAYFRLDQRDDQIDGSFGASTLNCGRLDEGGTVKGIVVGQVAVLVVTSGRNGAIVLGRATRRGGKLHWQAEQDIQPGQPDGDHLIPGGGELSRQAGTATR
jgi:hypothetical protein